jgi:hypothetical protein
VGILRIWREVIFDRGLLMIVYLAITIPVCILVILARGVGVGSAALVACAICLIASSTLVSCFLARREQKYSTKDLSIIAAIAMWLTLGGLALVRWSGFRLTLYGIEVSGIQWALIGWIDRIFLLICGPTIGRHDRPLGIVRSVVA